jgi:hypothetical protein
MENSTKHEFINAEYQQCFEHMRHYDKIAQELFKFSFTYYSAIVTLSLGIYQFFFANNHSIYSSLLYISAILLLSFLIGNSIILLLIRNRKYFIDVAHQVNGIRAYYINEINVFENKLSIDPEFPKLANPKSSQFIILYIFLFVNMILLFFSLLCFVKFYHIKFSFIISIIVSILYFIWGIHYTFKISKK